MTNVLVIGGGAAGCMAAITAAKAGATVTLWEKNDRLGRKLAITGKGRCNVTNAAPINELIANITGNGRFMHSAFAAFDNQAVMDFKSGSLLQHLSNRRAEVWKFASTPQRDDCCWQKQPRAGRWLVQFPQMAAKNRQTRLF